MSENHSICLFGGTFDPIHQGHIQIAKAAVEQVQLDNLIFLPCRQSPHKLNSKFASGEHRVAMCKLAVEDLEWAEVNEYDMNAPAPSYSWKTAEHFRSLYPDSKLYWLLGTDQWNALQSWNRIDHLAALLSFIVCTRGSEELVNHPFQPTVVQTDHPASSTAIRKAIGANTQPKWLNQSVQHYINSQELYSSND